MNSSRSCPKCKRRELQVAKALNGYANENEPHFLECKCGYYEFVYNPLPFQSAFHSSEANIKGYFGGFGAGKTTSGGCEIMAHILNVPNGITLIGAATISQMNNTCKKFIDDTLPVSLIKSTSMAPNDTRYQLHNGHRIMFRPLDDQGKLRSLNLTAAWIEEASEVDGAIFEQLKTRMRNQAANIYFKDKKGNPVIEEVKEGGVVIKRPKVKKSLHKIIITSNPDPGWIRTAVLFASSDVKYFGDDKLLEISLKSTDPEQVINRSCESFVVPTSANYFLPPNYIRDNAIGKPEWWKKRYLEGSFSYSEGSVYPNFMDAVVDPFKVPDDWPRYISVDFGRRDPMVYSYYALDKAKAVIYKIDEVYTPNGSEDIWFQSWADKWKLHIEGKSLGHAPVADAKGQNRGQASDLSWFKLFSQRGIYLTPAQTGKDISVTISRINHYIDKGAYKIFSNCVNTIREGREYRYKPRDLHSDKNADEVPIDKDNHAMDTDRYLISLFPETPEGLEYESVSAYSIAVKNKDQHALSDDEEDIEEYMYDHYRRW